MAIFGGPFIQLVFKIVSLNVEEIKHRFIYEDIKRIWQSLKNKKDEIL